VPPRGVRTLKSEARNPKHRNTETPPPVPLADLPDKSGVPVVVSGIAHRYRESLSCQGALALTDDLLDLRLPPAEGAAPNPAASSAGAQDRILLGVILPCKSVPSVYRFLATGPNFGVHFSLAACLRSLYARCCMKSICRMKSFASSVGKRQEPKLVLPDIKMRPKEMLTISRVLSRCDPLAQVIFITLMENWRRSGFEVATTAQTIVLDAPCGERTSPIAVLIEGDAMDKSSRPAAIVLCWDKLRKQKPFPRDALDTYQNTVRGIALLHVTPSSAHIYLVTTFTLAQAKRLLKAMKEFAGCIRPELAEPPPPVKPVTPDNMRGTLRLCPPDAQAIFKRLIAGWMSAGGAVQAKQTGRIYLRLKTKAHCSGNLARCQRRRQWETNWAFRNGSGTMAGDGNEKGPADRSTGPCRS